MTTISKNTTIKPVKSSMTNRTREFLSDFTNTVYLIRGLPGSGKTTIANDVNPTIRHPEYIHRAATDDWFTNDKGNYDFKPADLVINHAACLNWFETRVDKTLGANTIIVHNTFTMLWELHPYISYIKGKKDFRIIVLDIYDGGLSDDELAKRNTHGVGVEAIKRMRDRWVPWSWKDYDHYVGGIETFGKRWG